MIRRHKVVQLRGRKEIYLHCIRSAHFAHSAKTMNTVSIMDMQVSALIWDRISIAVNSREDDVEYLQIFPENRNWCKTIRLRGEFRAESRHNRFDFTAALEIA